MTILLCTQKYEYHIYFCFNNFVCIKYKRGHPFFHVKGSMEAALTDAPHGYFASARSESILT